MPYQSFLDEIQALDFIYDKETADAAAKAVLSMILSKLEETSARKILSNLPKELSLEVLQEHQPPSVPIPFEECVTLIGKQFKLSGEQAESLVDTVLRAAKKSMTYELLTEMERDLPVDWILAIEKA
jgi:uncharacterized protein (DUF2267 family)